MKKILCFICVAVMCVLVGCASEDSPIASSANTSAIPAIAGSNAYDVTVSLEKAGAPKANRSNADIGFTFEATSDTCSYEIRSNKDYEIAYAEFWDFGEEDGFLGYCASFPYSAAKSDEIMKWVNDNIGSEAATTIGDATFELAVGKSGPYLKVKAKGWDAYLEESMKSKS